MVVETYGSVLGYGLLVPGDHFRWYFALERRRHFVLLLLFEHVVLVVATKLHIYLYIVALSAQPVLLLEAVPRLDDIFHLGPRSFMAFV
jgi:hypothetical protein